MYPDRLVLQKGEPIYDYDVSDGGMVASNRFRDLVEAFDPGVHQFVPVAVEDHSGGPLGMWYFVRFLRPVNALQTEGAKGVPLVSPKVPHGDMGAVHIDAQSVFTVRADQIEGFGAWREKRATFNVFLSEALWQEVLAAGLTGVQARVHFGEV